MSEGIAVFGKRGQGKSKFAVYRMRQYLAAGRPVATNLNIFPENLVGSWCKTPVFRLPDFPDATDLNMLGLGNPGLYFDYPDSSNPDSKEVRMKPDFSEHKNGLLVLDEVGVFLNSRSWNDKSGKRQDIISWLLLSRKLGWDLLCIAQHPRLIDAQIRDSLFELQATVRRLDKMAIPVISRLLKIFGVTVKLPRVHVVPIRYGFGHNPPVCDTIYFQGDDLHAGYDTLQKIHPDTGVPNGSGYSLLSAWHLKGRYVPWWVMYKKIMIVGLVSGCFIAVLLMLLLGFRRPDSVKSPVSASGVVSVASLKFDEKLTATGFIYDGRSYHVLLSDGRTILTNKLLQEGNFYILEIEPNKWVKGKKQ